ncbi:MAG: hypothetical protein AAFO07_04240 [Bacteroidota bacterium]
MKRITVGIPMKSYLKKYALWRAGYPDKDIIDVSNDSNISLVASSLLSGKMVYTRQYHTDEDNKLGSYNDELLVRVKINHYNHLMLFYTRDGVRTFNKFVYQSFHDTLLDYILWNKSDFVPQKETIRKFLNMLEIQEDEISLDSIKKSNYRLRKKRDLGVFRVLGSKSA